ncbi:DUF2066 domain-containing protein [Spiribacter sp. 221]|uniref:DUF2066 domain-containing protein n=1 Tax=Spiribacter onubensis TaxID=3122420 RepID=UPI00349F69DA
MSFALRAICLVILLGGLLPVALAQSAPEAVLVPVADESESARDRALGEAMNVMLVRLTGDAAVTGTDLAERLRASAERYLVGFSYRAADEDAGMRLAVRFDETRLRGALGEAAVAIWPAPPPTVVVWLAVEQAGERFLVDGEQGAALRERLRAAAASSGLSLLFPLMDLRDRRDLGYADVAGGFADPVRAASARYAGEAVLAGRLRISDDGAVAVRWLLLPGAGEPVNRWQAEAGGTGPALASAVGVLAERLRPVYAYVPDPEAGRRVALTVAGVESLADHRRLQGYLEGLTGVERVVTTAVSGTQVRMQLAVSVDEARILEALARDERLGEADDGYRWR